jgi:hypothetical protein
MCLSSALHNLRQLARLLDILPLRTLVAPAEQDDDNGSPPHEIDAVARTMIYPHLDEPASERPAIAKIALLEPTDTSRNARLGAAV